MSAVTTHERPGVYSVYTVSAAMNGTARRGTAAIAAQSDGGTVGTVYAITGYAQAAEAFGENDGLTALVKLMLANGAGKVLATPVRTTEYAAAFALLAEEDDVEVVTCDSTTLAVQQALRDSVENASQARRERIAVVCAGPTETAAQMVTRASGLNSERVVLAGPATQAEDTPAGQVAAAVAGAICGESDPAVPLGGAVLRGIETLAASFGESDIDTMIRGGVTPVEMVGGKCSVIRGVTTRTRTGGVADRTWRELTTIRVVDNVIPGIRSALQARFTRAKNTAQVRGAIRSQVILELEQRKAAEIIAEYGEVTAEPLTEDPTVCLVTFSFTVAHELNQIWLSAQITV